MAGMNNGCVRIAKNRQSWHDFTLQRGCAYGRDKSGALFASYAVPANRYGMENALDGHIVVYRAHEHAHAGKMQGRLALSIARPKSHANLKSDNMVFAYDARLYVDDARYTKNHAWAIVWYPTQIPIDSGLGKAICKKIHAYKVTQTQVAKVDRYAGLANTFGKY